jgi:hypothetical protein
LTVAVVLLPVAGCTTQTVDPGKAERPGSSGPEDTLEPARETLAKSPDLAACRGALQQINAHLARHPQDRPPALTDEQRKFLQAPDKLGLDAGEVGEVAAETYTLLDGQHLDQCLLFRDVAHSLDVEGRPQPEQAAAAFSWVVREVRTQYWVPPAAMQGSAREFDFPEMPPHFVVRRGWGSSLERGVVLVTLLEQLGIPGCLFVTPGEGTGQGLAWGCGALVTLPDGGKEVLVFDPRLGLPLPGPQGQGIATLAQLRKQPELLKQLTADDKTPYDGTPEKVRASEVFLVAPLSALSPRMKHLQDNLLPARPPFHLAVDPAQRLREWEQVTGVPVRFWQYSTRALRRILPGEEGGVSKANVVKDLLLFQLVPLQAFPPRLLVGPTDRRFIGAEPQQRLFGAFAQPFHQFYLEAHRPPSPVTVRVKEDELIPEVLAFHGTRDLIVRGHFKDAIEELVQMRKQAEDQKNQLKVLTDAGEKFEEWCDRLREAEGRRLLARDPADAAAKRAQVEAVYKEGQEAVVFLMGRAAEQFGGDVVYHLALCMQEQAERLESRLERRRRAGQDVSDADAKAAREAWADANLWWERYLDEHPQAPGAPAARRQRARMCERLGDRETALALLADLSGQMTVQEKVARLYLAQQLKNKGN